MENDSALKLFATSLGLFAAVSASAQLLDSSLVNESAAIQAQGSVIGKSLIEQIGTGHGDIYTWASSQYQIARDPARSIRRGRQLFQRKFSYKEGLGPRVNSASSGDITAARALGAGLTDSCAACHGRPRGSAGFGGDVATRPDSRDAPHLFGLGLVEMLGDEMTSALRLQRADAQREAIQRGEIVRRKLSAKGVRFGHISVSPDGTLDTTEVEGVDPDLRVRPLFHHGGTPSIREFIVGAFNDEMGLQTYDPVLCAVTDTVSPEARLSPAGFSYDPALDSYARPPVCDTAADPDQDGINNEVDTALLDHMEFYLLNYFKPGQYRQDEDTRRGRDHMRKIGCTECHTQSLTVETDRRVADVETRYDPENAVFNDLYAVASTRFEIIEDGQEYPLLLPEAEPFVVSTFFSDLKRHDLGPAFHERDYDGTLATRFVTEPLWGVGSTAPYGHDGRSINLDAVIRRHGGEAKQARERYERMRGRDREQLLQFLSSLVLFPPDDTASNLNRGNPATDNPQDPSEHGSINLGALFQIPEEGAE